MSGSDAKAVAQQPAQKTMRANFINGGPGVIISGLVWVMAAIVTHLFGFQTGMISFFVGGMLIYPLSVVVSNFIKPKDTPKPDPKLMRLAMMTLPILFGGLLLAFIMSKSDPFLFYPIMAVAIGIRYVFFEKLYGLPGYIMMGASLVILGITSYPIFSTLSLFPLLIGLCEIGAGIGLTLKKEISYDL